MDKGEIISAFGRRFAEAGGNRISLALEGAYVTIFPLRGGGAFCISARLENPLYGTDAAQILAALDAMVSVRVPVPITNEGKTVQIVGLFSGNLGRVE